MMISGTVNIEKLDTHPVFAAEFQASAEGDGVLTSDGINIGVGTPTGPEKNDDEENGLDCALKQF